MAENSKGSAPNPRDLAQQQGVGERTIDITYDNRSEIAHGAALDQSCVGLGAALALLDSRTAYTPKKGLPYATGTA